jgi:hypothetical protein
MKARTPPRSAYAWWKVPNDGVYRGKMQRILRAVVGL